MSEYNNPFTGTPLGWDDGQNGWGQPLNSTLLLSAFYDSRNIKAVLASLDDLPLTPAEGDAYLVSSHVRAYFRSSGEWHFATPPENMEFNLEGSADIYIRVGSSFVLKSPFISLDSPALTGNPTAPTPPVNDNDTSIATTAYVQTELLDRPQTIESFAALSATAATIGQIVSTMGHTSHGIGARDFIAKSGSVTSDGGSRINSATPEVYWEWLDLTQASIADFGASPASTALTDAALTLCEAADRQFFTVPPYSYTTTKSLFSLKKTYEGDGQIALSGGDYAPGNVTFVESRPDGPELAGLPFDFQGDISKTKAKYYILGESARTNLNDNYFQVRTTPKYLLFDNRAGSSGTLALTTNAPTAGSSTLSFTDTTAFFVNQVIGINDSSDNITDIATVTAVTPTSVSISPALTASYPLGTRVTDGKRTMCPADRVDVIHRGRGDAYAYLSRVEVSKEALPSQSHIFFNATGGIIGGDLSASATGVFLTGTEINHNDNGYDVGCVGSILNFQRNNSTGGRGAFWAGMLIKSEGSQEINSGVGLAGKIRAGIDTVKADFGSGMAINLAAGQKIGLDGSATDMAGYSLVGNVMATTYTFKNNDNSRVENFYNGILSFAWNDTRLAIAGRVDVGTDVNLPINGKVNLEGVSGDTYIQYNGINIQLVKNGVVVASW